MVMPIAQQIALRGTMPARQHAAPASLEKKLREVLNGIIRRQGRLVLRVTHRHEHPCPEHEAKTMELLDDHAISSGKNGRLVMMINGIECTALENRQAAFTAWIEDTHKKLSQKNAELGQPPGNYIRLN